MKKFLLTMLVIWVISGSAQAFPVDTSDWVCSEEPGQLSVVAAEIDLKSDLKQEYRVYQTYLENKTNSTLDI